MREKHDYRVVVSYTDYSGQSVSYAKNFKRKIWAWFYYRKNIRRKDVVVKYLEDGETQRMSIS